jgi:hypothetical protein
MIESLPVSARELLRSGVAIPAHPLALTAARKLDERRQRALTRYYFDAGAGGVAVGVHTTQFAIRETNHGLYRPVLQLAADTIRELRSGRQRPFVMVAGLCGETAQAVADVMPLFGFYLQPAVGGRVLDYAFWRDLAELPNLWAVKIAPFSRYQTFDVVRAIGASGRDDIALYTGNDDNIVGDLVTQFPVNAGGISRVRHIDGGLLGQWAVWTHRAVGLLSRAKAARGGGALDPDLLREGAALTDANSAIFDAGNGFAGCIAGIHEVLRRQGLLAGIWCLDPRESLSPGQADEIDRVCRAYPFLADDEFVAEGLDSWLA